ncbi:unnamed protein product [Arabis nemorensis]|uniref:Uncharacterized protein n=1 Tax=Arabis nemorensis TaxID=586526 RepID=A0A565CA15_9BRAS|nr:unnamed protein product [Arabis nemorensis]
MKKKKKSTKKKCKASKKKKNVSIKKVNVVPEVNAEVENALLAAVKKAREFLLAERLMLRLARKCSYEDVISGLGVSLKAMVKDMLLPNPLAVAAAARSKAEAKAERKKKKLAIAVKHAQNSAKNTGMKVSKLDSDSDS